jgi:ATP-dependent Clp protease adapter protein ClpS
MGLEGAATRHALASSLAELPRSGWLSFRPPTPDYQHELARALAHAIAAERPQLTAPFLAVEVARHLPDAVAERLARAGFAAAPFTRAVAHGTVDPPPVPADGMVSVVFCNDPFTTMEMVVTVLREVFDVTSDAERLMRRVHENGRAVIGTMDAATARPKIDAAHSRATAAGMPLRVLALPADPAGPADHAR